MAVTGLVVDPASFERKAIGPVWGTVFFQFDQGSFPASGWSDIVVPIVTAWLAVTTRAAAAAPGRHVLHFMDGPFSMALRRIDDASVALELVHRTEVTARVTAEPSMLLDNALAVGRRVDNACHARGWKDYDTAALTDELHRASIARSARA
jgi:hypothetical protein